MGPEMMCVVSVCARVSRGGVWRCRREAYLWGHVHVCVWMCEHCGIASPQSQWESMHLSQQQPHVSRTYRSELGPAAPSGKISSVSFVHPAKLWSGAAWRALVDAVSLRACVFRKGPLGYNGGQNRRW